MKNKYESIHLIIGFGVLFLVPIAQKVDSDFFEISKYLAIGYWGIVGFYFLFTQAKDYIAEEGAKKLIFNLWLYSSLLIGGAGLYITIRYGLDDAPFAIYLVIYGAVIGYIFRAKLK